MSLDPVVSAYDAGHVAAAWYGKRWVSLPPALRGAVVVFVAELIASNVSDLLDGFDVCFDSAVRQTPLDPAERYALLTDDDVAQLIFNELDIAWSLDGVPPMSGADGTGASVWFSASVGLGYGLALERLFGEVLWELTTNGSSTWAAFDLCAGAAEVARALFPEWSGTVAELVAAAAALG